jgi:outer membrane biosynthesis protein TonB
MPWKHMLWVVALAFVFPGGCSKKVDDAALVTNIRAEVFADPQLKDADLQVTSHNGQVTLKGTVPSDASHWEAYRLVSQTTGVAKVIDQLSVESAEAVPPGPAAAPGVAPAEKPVDSAPPRRTHPKEAAPAPEATEMAEGTPPPAPLPEVQAAPASQPTPAPAPAAPPPPPQPKQVDVPAGTTMTIRMIDGVDSSVNRAGEIFHAWLEAPLVVDDQAVVPKGADVYVRLATASSSGHATGKSALQLELVKVEFQGRSYPLVSSTYNVSGSSRGKDTAKKVGAGAVLGTLIGAIARGGRGAAIGAGVGAGAGGVYQGMTKGKQVKVPSETKLDFQLEQPVTVTVLPRSSLPTE